MGNFNPVRQPKKADAEVQRLVWDAENVKIALDAYEQGIPLIATPFLSGQPMLRRPALLYEWADAELVEATKCADDILYFADTYIELFLPSGIYGHIELRPYQRRYLKMLQDNRFVVFVAARQIGKTVTSAIFMLWLMIFHPYTKIACLGDKFATAAENIQKIKDMYVRLPFWLKPGITTWNKSTIAFDNGSYVFAAPCTLAAIVGKTLSIVYFDEAAIVDDHIMRNVFEFAYPTISALKDSRIIMTSSPRGAHGVFYETYIKAVLGKSPFRWFKVEWQEVPGRDEQWHQEQLAILGERGFDQQYGNKFINDDEAWLTAETMDDIQELCINANYVPIFELTDKEKQLAYLGKVERVIMKSKYWTKATIRPKVPLVKMLQFDNNSIASLHQLHDLPVLIIIDTGEGKRLDYTTVGFYVPDFGTEQQQQMQEAYEAELAELEVNATIDAATYTDDDAAFDAMVDDDSDIETAGFASEYLFGQSIRTKQIGALSTNLHCIPMVALFIQLFVRYFCNMDKVKIICELDGIGAKMQALLASDILPNSGLEAECFGSADNKHPGILMRGKNKSGFVYDTQQLLETGRILPTYGAIAFELTKFREIRPGKFAGVDAHDDWAMNVVQLGGYMQSSEFKAWCEDNLLPDEQLEDADYS